MKTFKQTLKIAVLVIFVFGAVNVEETQAQVMQCAGCNITGANANGAGVTNTISGYASTALGSQNTVTGNYSLGAGYSHNVAGNRAVSLGDNNDVAGKSSSAIGSENSASVNHSHVIGKKISNDIMNSFMVGFSETPSNMPTLFVNSSQIGVGTTSPQAELDVVGDVFASGKTVLGSVSSTPAGYKLYVEEGILTEKVKVALQGTSGWADHVFEKEYDLLPLEEVETHIVENGHLHKQPSAKTLVKNGGFELGEMAAMQQEKIEEIYLHLINMNKELKCLKAENDALKSELESLKK